jgi:energy-coupling factor transporter ATP-binding protein EcfA2
LPGTELQFDPGHNIVLGRNGAGKTTLLNLIAAVTAGTLRGFDREQFDLDFELDAGDVHVVAAVRNEPRAKSGELLNSFDDEADPEADADDVEELASHFHFTASAVFSADGKLYKCTSSRGGIRVAVDGADVGNTDEPATSDEFLIDLARAVLEVNAGADRKSHPLFALLRLLFPLARNLRRLDESLETFGLLTSYRALIRTTQRHTFLRFGFLSDELRKALVAAFAASPDAKTAPIILRRVPFLEQVAKLFGYVACSVTLPLRRKQTINDVTYYHYGAMIFAFESANGNVITHERLSYGQKRLLSFFYYAAANPHVIVADELVNGLHHGWIEQALTSLEGRQAFLTSQNPLLLDHLAFGSVEEAANRFICCEGDDAELRWTNLTHVQADRFYRAYAAGIQYVGEILRQENLW